MCYYERTGGAAETAIKTLNTAVYHVLHLLYFILFYFILFYFIGDCNKNIEYSSLSRFTPSLFYFSLFTVCVIS